jgi:phosphoserine phosphatase
VQEASWPAELPAVPGYDAAAWAQAALEAGGDTYDAAVAGDGALWLLMADATGHGVGPALASAQVRSMFRMAVRADLSLDDAMRFTHAQLDCDMPPGRFVTAFFGRLDPRTHRLQYTSAGHGPVYLRDAAGGVVELESTGVPLGLDADIEPGEVQEVAVEPGGLLALFTDGLFESLNPQEASLGSDAIRQELAKPGDALSVLARLRDRLERHAAGRAYDDDVTVMLLHRDGR